MPEKLALNIAGHDIRLQVEADEKDGVESIANGVSLRIQELTEKMTTSSQAKIATMIAFEFACQLADANEMLEEAEKLRAEVESQKEAVHRLEGLLDKVDDALLA